MKKTDSRVVIIQTNFQGELIDFIIVSLANENNMVFFQILENTNVELRKQAQNLIDFMYREGIRTQEGLFFPKDGDKFLQALPRHYHNFYLNAYYSI